MAIKNEKQYKVACDRIEELLKVVNNDTPTDDKYYIELDMISDLVADYEETYYPVKPIEPAELIKYAIAERNMTQKQLAEELNISTSRVSDYITGRSTPTLKIAGKICRILEISPDLMLGIQ
ncbi:MAG: helix-turn-helix protein [Bacteroidetes bacterium ADurb.Bin174]|nr:MAG: helix-turn-helix protein [Bacteroidetes bacterium ADurb.Bin174]